MALIPWWIRYPNVNDEIMNLDWLLRVSNENTEKISNFINLNTIKYADPILWDITSQYEANTVTVDPQTGDAYISTKPVPYGVSLSNTDYWTKIYNYADEINGLKEQIAAANEGLSTTASAPRAIGDLVWLNGLLYEVTAPMIAGDSYVVNSNIKKTTIEEQLKKETDARVNADSLLDGKITTLSDNLTTLRDNYLEYKRNGVVNVKDFGALGDGVADDTAAIQEALDSVTNGVVVFPRGTYLISDTLHLAGNLGGNYILFGESELKWIGAEDASSFMISIDKMINDAPESQCIIDGLILNGNVKAHGGIITNCFHDIIQNSKFLDFTGVAIEIGVTGNWKSIQTYLSNLYIFQVLADWSTSNETVGIRFNMPDCLVDNIFINRYHTAIELNDGNHVFNNLHLGEQRHSPVANLTGTAFKLNSSPAPCNLVVNNAYIDTMKYVFNSDSYLWNVILNNSFYYFNDAEVTGDCEVFISTGSAFGIDVNNIQITPSHHGLVRDTFNNYGVTENMYQNFKPHPSFLHPDNNEIILANNRCHKDEFHVVIEAGSNTTAGRYYRVGAIINDAGTNDLVKIRMSQGWYCYEEHIIRRTLTTWNVDNSFVPAANNNFEIVVADNPTTVNINGKNFDVYYIYIHYINAYDGQIRLSIEPLSGNIFRAYAYTSQNRDDYTDVAPVGTTLPKS